MNTLISTSVALLVFSARWVRYQQILKRNSEIEVRNWMRKFGVIYVS